MGSSPAYPSDLADAQWALIEPLVPVLSTHGKGTRGGRPLKYSRRRIVDAILYVDRTGCSWRQLPHDFPPWATVYYYFQRWAAQGLSSAAAAIEERLTDLRDCTQRIPRSRWQSFRHRRGIIGTDGVSPACPGCRDCVRRAACGPPEMILTMGSGRAGLAFWPAAVRYSGGSGAAAASAVAVSPGAGRRADRR
jgi:transposase